MTAITRENATAKAHRLLAEGRLIVRETHPYIFATCRGDSGELYRLGWDPSNGRWRCGCPSKGRCSHLIALQLVTVKP